ncbi:MAG: helix-hairpin-helix domain-containing protein [Clostridia bacterium]|nr:helix-hairpin-helix domain-containing protein [Clostridia bacterium]
MDIIKNNKKLLIIVMAVVFIVGIIAIIYITNHKDDSLQLASFSLNNEGKVEAESVNGKSTEGQNEDLSKNVEKGREGEENIIYIHIIGEVKNQGIIKLQSGQRIIDAIEKAGGVTEEADISKVNLAFILSDGQKVRIPNVNDKEENVIYVTDSSGKNVILDAEMGVAIGNGGANGGKVNINTANQTELETLSGIGPSLAAKIIEHREKNGKFKSVEELKNVSGIGDAKFEGIRKQVVIK